MKHIISILVAVMFATTIFAKDEQGLSKKEIRAANRAAEAKKDSIAGAIAKNAIENGEWIFKAVNLTVVGGPAMNVPQNLNFLMVEDDEFTFQTSTGFGGGPNSMGGITTSGSVKLLSSEVDKHGNTTYEYHLNSSILNAKVSLYLLHNSNRADVYMNMDMHGKNISMNGSVYTVGATNIFEGSKM